MADITKKQHSKKMLIIGLAAGMVIAAPLGYRAYANEGTNEKVKDAAEVAPVTVPPKEEATVEASVEQSIAVAPNEAVAAEVDAAAQTQVTTTTVPEEETTPTEPGESDSTAPTPVADLQAAIGIAVAEHDAKVVSAKVKTLGAETVYKVTFDDGFSVYVSADDGEVLILKDRHGKHQKVRNVAKHAWHKKHDLWDLRSEQFRAWAMEWLKQHPWFAEQLAQFLQQWQPVAPTTPEQPATEESTPVAPAAETQVRADVRGDRRDKSARVDASARYEEKSRSYGVYGQYYGQYQNAWTRR